MLFNAFHRFGGSAVVDEIKDVDFVGADKLPEELVTVIGVIF